MVIITGYLTILIFSVASILGGVSIFLSEYFFLDPVKSVLSVVRADFISCTTTRRHTLLHI